MAEFFAVSAENLTDCHALGQLESAELRSVDAALMEPLACVVKSLTRAGNHDRVAVIGLGVMGLLHALLVPTAVGVDLNPKRRNWASEHGLDARESAGPGAFDLVIVCPGTETALTSAIELCAPGATIVLFSPFGPPGQAILPVDTLYFNDINLITSYSCGPVDTATALELFKQDKLRAEQVVSHFISIDELPNAYQSMKRGDILKPMVIF
jgi:L-iditol 2-dehydrogenase